MSNPLPPTKLSVVRAALAAGDVKTALRIAAKFPELGAHRDRITKAWAALQNPLFYKELGYDPQKLVDDGITAIRERYHVT